ncbi:MAG: hypothetical protein AAFQ63_18555 [Cyanobacteria bacterium J06621_11]
MKQESPTIPVGLGGERQLRNYQRYREAYPTIEASPPSEVKTEIIDKLKSPEGDKPALARVKRWGKGLKEVAAEIEAVRPSALRRFEQGQLVEPEEQEQILKWLSR